MYSLKPLKRVNTNARLSIEIEITRMWANAQPDGRPAEHRWHPLFNAQSLADGHYLTATQ